MRHLKLLLVLAVLLVGASNASAVTYYLFGYQDTLGGTHAKGDDLTGLWFSWAEPANWRAPNTSTLPADAGLSDFPRLQDANYLGDSIRMGSDAGWGSYQTIIPGEGGGHLHDLAQADHG